MANRKLPSQHNTKLDVLNDDPEKFQEYVEKRKLGQTDLVKIPGESGLLNSTEDPDSHGRLDYAYLRVPLPKDLSGSGIFNEKTNTNKGGYFLMRRSMDGFVSATGMFRLAFPWASLAEEEAEKKHLFKIPDADPSIVAGNIWIPVEHALTLADEYNIRDWVMVLLDPSPIQPSSEKDAHIASPPVYKFPAKSRAKASKSESQNASKTETDSTANGTSSSRKRVTRSASPSKDMPSGTPSRKIATPKRVKRGRPPGTASKLASTAEEPEDNNNDEGGGGDAANVPDTEDESQHPTMTKKKRGAAAASKSTEETEEKRTPSLISRAGVSIRDEAQAQLDHASEFIKKATDLSANRRKRKAADAEMEDEAIDFNLGGGRDGENSLGAPRSVNPKELQQPAPKRVKVTELELRKEKMMRRAGMGIAASLAIGVIVPVLGGFFQSI